MRSDKYVLDDAGNPKPCDDVLEWGRWFETADRSVAKDDAVDVRVSTVFLGLDHRFGDGPPVLYETMVFAEGRTSAWDDYQERYATAAEAALGHRRVVEAVRAGTPPA